MNDSWESFAGALQEESLALGRVNEAALALTKALVYNEIEAIGIAERDLDAARKLFQAAAGKRRGMQVRGFGRLTLRQVCAYAPRKMLPYFNHRLSELATRSISLRITTENNKSLIVSGMDRLIKVTCALQKAAAEKTGTYKRRGYVAPPSNSVLVSSNA